MLSLNGPPAVHDRSRGISGSYRQVMELSSLLATRHVTYGYNFAMFPFNAHCLKHVFNLSRERGASFNVGFPCNHLRLTAGLARELLETIVHPEHVPIIVRNLCEMEDFPQGRELARFVIWFYGSRRIRFNCHAIREYLFVDPHGNVFPCDQIEKRLELGNLREANLEVILMSTQCRDLLKALREQSCQRQCMATCFALNEYLRARENNQLLKMLSWARWQVARVPVLRAFKRALLPRHW